MTTGYCETHKAEGQAWYHNGLTPAQRGYDWQWEKTRKRVLKRGKHLCQPCLRTGRPTPATEVDHIIPKSRGGSEDESNLQAICSACHTEKTQSERS